MFIYTHYNVLYIGTVYINNGRQPEKKGIARIQHFQKDTFMTAHVPKNTFNDCSRLFASAKQDD